MRLENPDDEIYTKKLKPSAVQHSDPLFLLYPPTNFACNLRSLKKKIVDLREAVNFDQAAFEKEKKLHPRQQFTEHGNPFWDTSDARRILEIELKDENIGPIIEALEPKDVWKRHFEYQLFPLEVFRKQLHHMKTKLTGEVFWQAKRNRKGRKAYEVVLEVRLLATSYLVIVNTTAPYIAILVFI
eukprot:scaffold18311_cov71-Cylindrotheca_fusiformis.AAC.1